MIFITANFIRNLLMIHVYILFVNFVFDKLKNFSVVRKKNYIFIEGYYHDI